MAYNDVYKITLTGIYQGVTFQNVFNYLWDVGNIAGNALTWRATFEADVLPFMAAVAVDGVDYLSIQCVNWRDPSDFSESALAVTGDIDSVTNDPLASWLTLNFRMNRNNPGQYHGFKRFIGGVEEMFDAGNPSTAFATEIEALETALAAGLDAASGRAAHYFVVDSRTSPEYGANPPGYVSLSCTYRGLGTQKSRKP